MRVYFTTVVRKAPPERSGEIVAVDWDTKRVVARHPMSPSDHPVEATNPRGGVRGGKGVAVAGSRVVGATYHTLRLFDPDLEGYDRGISDGWTADLHGLSVEPDGTLLASVTAVDGVLRIDLDGGEILDAWWPRNWDEVQERLGVEPLGVEPDVDYRTIGAEMDAEIAQDPSHLHLNAVDRRGDERYALLNDQAAIVNLDRERVELVHPDLESAHDLRFADDGTVWVNDTADHTLRRYDLDAGELVGSIDPDRAWRVRGELLAGTLRHRVDKALEHLGLGESPGARPRFLRGMARTRDRLLVGTSPATVLEVDPSRGEIVDAYRHTSDYRVAIFGVACRP